VKKPFCTCPAYKFRELKRHGVCKHITAVKEYLAGENKDLFEEVLEYVKEHSEVDSIELIDKFGEEAVNELISRGDLIEQKGLIRLLN
jgi:predicted nucleic acid-binding Zn finger protein